MRRLTNLTALIFVLFFCSTVSCKKFLSEIPDKSLMPVKDVKTLQGLLNNVRTIANQLMAGLLSDDDIYYDVTDINSLPESIRTFYTWKPDIDLFDEWQYAYTIISDCNIVLYFADDPGITGSPEERKQVKGAALFFRALMYYQLSQIFTPPYSPATANIYLGLPLKTSPEVGDMIITRRSTLQQTYDQVLRDLKESFPLLPAMPESRISPGKAAASGLLARTYLVLGRYDSALRYAQVSLGQEDSLMDYNDIPSPMHSPSVFSAYNAEVSIHTTGLSVPDFNKYQKVNNELYQLYDTNDLRRSLYYRFDNGQVFRGSYSGSNSELFSGIAVDEVWLIRSESYARLDSIKEAVDDLNWLLRKRWARDKYISYVSANKAEVIKKILEERRKELAFRPNIRWTDLRRLYLGIQRTINGSVYSLPPGSLVFTFKIPEKEILASGIEQNLR